MTEETNRSYRKLLTSQGLIYLVNQEMGISVRNLSITGMLAELDSNTTINGIEDVYAALKGSAAVDFYLPEMRLAGEAMVVRAEKIEELIYLAMEFRNLSFDVSNLLYKRKAYRKLLSSSGHITAKGETFLFLTQNVSVDGMMISLKENINLSIGEIASFNFPRLNLQGEVRVVWFEYEEGGYTLMGLEYENLIKGDINDIPRFSPVRF